MPADEKKGTEKKLITEKQRFNYIGFDVFPGKPKDLFKSEAEKNKYLAGVKARQESGETLREQCTLTEERVSLSDRLVLTVASLVLIASLFLPWFSAYNEIVEKAGERSTVGETEVESTMPAQTADSLGGLAATTTEDEGVITGEVTEGDEESIEQMEAAEEAQPANESPTSSEEILHGYVAKKKITKDYSRVTGIGTVVSIGSVGSYVFSSGFILMISGVLVILMVLSCLLIPIYNLYGLYGIKGDSDKKALALKKILKLNWIPLVLFMVVFVLSFFGASYGFSNPADMFTSLGMSYNVGVFFGSISYGLLFAVCASILVAAKGMEI